MVLYRINYGDDPVNFMTYRLDSRETMILTSVAILYAIIIVLLGISSWIVWTTESTIVRPGLFANWSGSSLNLNEGFINLTKWLPVDNDVTGKQDCNAGGPGIYNSNQSKSFDLLENPGYPEPRVAKGPTSERCYKSDWESSKELTGSYEQITNNYKHALPESCSAPNHDLILNFYKPVTN